MPTYRYKCRKCEQTFSLQASIEEKSKGLSPECPDCGSEDVFQSFANIGVIGSSSSGKGNQNGCSSCPPGAGCC